MASRDTVESVGRTLATTNIMDSIECYERGGGDLATNNPLEDLYLDDFAIQLIDFAFEPTIDKLNALERVPWFEDMTVYTNFFYEGVDGDIQIALYNTKRVRHYASLHQIHVGYYGMNFDPVSHTPLRLILNTDRYTIQDQGEIKTVWRAYPYPFPPPPSPAY
ncbi:MAG: hypothetical protein CMB67_04585 [Euryarchaeota archaeon]|nr:hypothetical protein [Euryarchaeota archaeon]|tara:strand:+ start:266 stop:754 length:489 start_codon:yes stop_codon:yes gene_type:complete